jgi:adenosylhomocysteine nucleosidase
MENIGLIAAMPQESGSFLRFIKERKNIPLRPFRGVRFQIHNRNCLLVTSGMGLKRASDAARSIMAAASPDLLISFGIAGAINDDLLIGDVVIARNSCTLDKGLPVRFHPLASLSEAAWNAAFQALHSSEAHLVSGTAITTHGSQVFSQGLQEIPNPVLEMETAGIAQVAAEWGIPLLSIRSISDGPRSPIPFDLEAILDDNDNLRIGTILKMVFRRPQLIFQSRHMMQNSKIAADHAAAALVAVLRQPHSITIPDLGFCA